MDILRLRTNLPWVNKTSKDAAYLEDTSDGCQAWGGSVIAEVVWKDLAVLDLNCTGKFLWIGGLGHVLDIERFVMQGHTHIDPEYSHTDTGHSHTDAGHFRSHLQNIEVEHRFIDGVDEFEWPWGD